MIDRVAVIISTGSETHNNRTGFPRSQLVFNLLASVIDEDGTRQAQKNFHNWVWMHRLHQGTRRPIHREWMASSLLWFGSHSPEV